ncbi:MFS transporter [Corynebacterium freiburgense]|uniref:MFS transporter n=1 Tax=Corynebacterium freiburgense TaxID=556548 RepID=UPI00042846CF|nr:MFS transporter [Corynebacterium freiburgense]WJZ03254.1 Antiseptic resistance protein [Corynebacterium freiburgense]
MNTVATVNTQQTHKWWVLVILATGLSLIVLDATIVGVSMPSIMHELELSLVDAQRVTALYNTVLAALLLASGRLGDRVGRKHTFVAGLGFFLAGSVLAALSTTAWALIGGRIIQGIGGALILPSTLSTVNALFRGKDRASAFGVWGAVISGAAAVGPLAGGMITQWAHWRWIFWVNVPLGLLLMIVALRIVPNTRGDATPGFDWIGLVLSAVGFGGLVHGIIQKDITITVLSCLVLLAFIVWERLRLQQQKAVLLDLSMLQVATFTWGNLTAMMVAIGEFGLVFVLPLFLISGMNLSTLTAGAVLAAMAVGAFLSGAMARHLAAAIGPSGVVMLGLVLEVFGALQLAAEERADQQLWLVAFALVIYGVGLGLASAQLTSLVLGDVPAKNSGQAAAAQSTIRQIGSALGTAIMGTVLSWALKAYVSGPGADAVIASGGAALTGMRQHMDVTTLVQGFADATRITLYVTVAFIALGFICSLMVRRYSANSRVE